MHNNKFAPIFIIGCLCGTAGASTTDFALIEPIQQIIDVPDVPRADVSIVIRSSAGQPAYLVACHSSYFNHDTGFEYSGDFECRMTPIGSDTAYSTLFAEDLNQSRDWESRARFFAANLKGECARIPEFGSTRDFTLRGMRVTMRILEPQFDNTGHLVSLKFQFVAQADSFARREISEIVPLPVSSPPQCAIAKYFAGQTAAAPK